MSWARRNPRGKGKAMHRTGRAGLGLAWVGWWRAAGMCLAWVVAGWAGPEASVTHWAGPKASLRHVSLVSAGLVWVAGWAGL